MADRETPPIVDALENGATRRHPGMTTTTPGSGRTQAGPLSAVLGARDMWRVIEPYHAVLYFAPEAPDEYRDAGLKGGWMGYFASRSAAMGAVGSETVVATFHNFAPAMVRRAIPDAWKFSSPERVLEARLRVADASLRRLLGDAVETEEVVEAAFIAGRAASSGEPAGRPLFAGHVALPIPDAPHLALWHACAALREHRFDCHVAMLTGYGVGGLEAHLLLVGAGVIGRDVIQPARGWTDEQWDAGVESLRERGWLGDDAELTDAGRAVHEAVEKRTDNLAQAPYDAIGREATARLHALLTPLRDRITEAGGIPPISPLALR
jgi:hypothetical protein